MKELDLNPRYLHMLTEIIEKVWSNTEVKILAYGSRVTGNATEASDLDLVLKTDNYDDKIKRKEKLFKQLISDSNIPLLIQVQNWQTMPDFFKTEINKHHLVIFDNILVSTKKIN